MVWCKHFKWSGEELFDERDIVKAKQRMKISKLEGSEGKDPIFIRISFCYWCNEQSDGFSNVTKVMCLGGDVLKVVSFFYVMLRMITFCVTIQ